MQKREKISPSRSSAVNSPVIDENACCAARNSSAKSSIGGGSRLGMRGRSVEMARCIVQCEELPLAREKGVLRRMLDAGDALYRVFEQPDAFAGQRAQPDMRVGCRRRSGRSVVWKRRGDERRLPLPYVGRDPREIAFVVDDDARQRRGQFARKRVGCLARVRIIARSSIICVAGVDQQQREVGACDRGPRACDAERFDRIGRLSQSRGVDDGQRNPARSRPAARPYRASCPGLA